MKNVVHNFCDCPKCEKDQEDAEKWNNITKYMIFGEFGAMKGVEVSLDELLESILTVERLKQSIEYYKPMEQGWEEGIVLGELQRILKGGYKIIDNPKWKTCCKDTGEELPLEKAGVDKRILRREEK